MHDAERIERLNSPDGTFSIEQSWRPDERSLDWYCIRIIAEPSGRVIADLPLFELAGAAGFLGFGQVLLPLRHRYGRQMQLAVDVAAGTFTLDSAEAAQPLAVLPSRLAELTAIASPASPIRSAARGAPLDLLLAIGGSLFVTGGLLLALIAGSDKDRLMGVLGILFFGACTALPMLGLQPHWPRLAPHLPLLVALAVIPWTIACMALLLFTVDDAPGTIGRAQTRGLTAAVAVAPAMFGLLWALLAGVRGTARNAAGRLSLLLGGIACLTILGWFIWQIYD